MNKEQEKASTPTKKRFLLPLLIMGAIIIFIGLPIVGGFFIWHKLHTAKNLTIPDRCPKNIPIYPNSKIISVNCRPDGSSIESSVKIDQKTVKKWYFFAVQDKGWKIRNQDSGSYLFNNDQEIGKVSLSIEKKTTVIKFLTAKNSAVLSSTEEQSSYTPDEAMDSENTDNSQSWFNIDDFLKGLIGEAPSDQPAVDEDNPAPEDYYTEDPDPENNDDAPASEPDGTDNPSDEPTPEVTDTPTPTPSPSCWIDDKGNQYCNYQFYDSVVHF